MRTYVGCRICHGELTAEVLERLPDGTPAVTEWRCPDHGEMGSMVRLDGGTLDLDALRKEHGEPSNDFKVYP